MNQLVEIKGNDVFTDSLIIADGTDNDHNSVTRLIRKYHQDFEYFGKVRFMDFKSKNSKGGRPQKIYILNEPQATLLMTYMNNNQIVRSFKKKLVKEFYTMKSALMQRGSTEWLQTRKMGMLARRNETDAIAELIEYAKKQGSKNSHMFYVNYTKLVNDAVGIKTGEREFASQKVLDTIAFLEDMILHTIREEMRKGAYYKDIYKICKSNTYQIVRFAYLPEQKLLIS